MSHHLLTQHCPSCRSVAPSFGTILVHSSSVSSAEISGVSLPYISSHLSVDATVEAIEI